MSWDVKLFHRHLNTRRFGREVMHFEEIDSTNRWVIENQDRFTISGGVVVTDHQTAGRGRHDRSWFDAREQSLLFSILLRHLRNDSVLALLSFLPAIALGELLRESTPDAAVSLKWPNDVLMNGRKIAGVLGHASGSSSARFVVLGTGVNVAGRIDEFPEDLAPQASSIEAEGGGSVRREVLLGELLNRMEPMFDDVLEGDCETICSRWLRLGPPLGTAMTRREGSSVYSGTFTGLGKSGELLLREESGQVQVLLSGDIEQT